jgi:hypothetical protein
MPEVAREAGAKGGLAAHLADKAHRFTPAARGTEPEGRLTIPEAGPRRCLQCPAAVARRRGLPRIRHSCMRPSPLV